MNEGTGAPGRNRTCDPRIKSPVLCRLSYRRTDEKIFAKRTASLQFPQKERLQRVRFIGFERYPF